MKNPISFGISIAFTIIFFTYVGHLFGNIGLGIITGFILAILYLFSMVFKK